MQRSPLNYRTAFLLALGISLLMNLIFIIMFFYGRDAVMPRDGEPVRQTFKLGNTLMHLFFNFLVAFLLYLINFRLLRNRWASRYKWLYIVLITIVCAGVISYVCSVIQLQFQDFGPHPERFIRGGMFRDYFIAVVVLLSSQLIYLSYKQQQTVLENEMLLAENLKTRLTALKNQVDPHFLFNSLNTLNSLIRIDTDKAQEYVQQLSFVFRYTLQNKDVISLEEELKFTRAYCMLMQIRYGDSLQFVELVDEKYYDYQVIPLSLQILVENAIKHNVVSNRQPLKITISTSDQDTISVSNPVQLKKESEGGEGIGLANLTERYRLMWQQEIIISYTEDRFEVIIPLKK